MIPYLDAPANVPWFGILVALGVFVGIRIARGRAPAHGIDPRLFDSLVPWMLLSSFACSHLVHAVFYEPAETLRRPIVLLEVWHGHSSLGGFLGTLIGGLVWRRVRYRGQPLMPLSDLIMSAFPIAWTIGRAGCAVIHDHKGKAADASIFTVAFPDGPHYDLGLLEMVACMGIAAVSIAMWKQPRRIGTYTGVGMVLYAPVRFGLDFLRVDDETRTGLTPGQWGTLALFGFGCWILVRRPRAEG